MLKALFTTVTIVLCAGSAWAAAPFDALFLRHEAQGSAYELAIAKLAQDRSSRPELRSYAATVASDHSSYNAALRALAHAKGVNLPSDLTSKDQSRVDEMAKLNGPSFDSAFLAEARRVNAEDMRDFRKEASRTTDPQIRSFVTKFLAVDQKHEAGAQALSNQASNAPVTSRMPVIKPPATGATMPVIPPPQGGTMPVITPPVAGAK